jgi:UDP-glucose 4-epimerase
VKRIDLPAPGGVGPAHVALLFGSGILGGAIVRRLSASAAAPPVDLSWPWGDAQDRRGTADALVAALGAERPRWVSLVWAAGRSGMGSTTDDMDRETELFREVLAFGRMLATSTGAEVHIHLVSSAGGLFDGRTHVGIDSVAEPTRPYGVGKLAQEQALEAAAEGTPALSYHVYRPTTVYGFQAGARMGLVPILILNGLAGRSSTIIGRADTIRDYVWTEDVARFIAGRVVGLAPSERHPLLLASGRPAPLGEIVWETEHLLGRQLHLRYDPRPSNSANMSFRPSAIPSGLRPIDIRSGIRRVAEAVRSHAFRLDHG